MSLGLLLWWLLELPIVIVLLVGSALSPLLWWWLGRRTRAGVPIIVMHGWGMASGCMFILALRLRRAGFAPVGLDFSWLLDMERASAKVAARARAIAERAGIDRVDVVAHSLGGLVTRHARLRADGGAVGRLVSIGSPLRGARTGHFAVGWMRMEIRRGAPPPACPEDLAGDLAITSTGDWLIPCRTATLDPPGRTKMFAGVGHGGMLLAAHTAAEVIDQLRLPAPPPAPRQLAAAPAPAAAVPPAAASSLA